MARPLAFQPVPTAEPIESADTDDLLTDNDASSPERLPSSPLHLTEASSSKLTRLNGLALVISLQIGSGIFTAPSQVSAHVPSAGLALAVWFLGGLLVWTGAAAFIELGLRVPRNGGIQEYLRACYGDGAGFLFAWMWVAVAKPAANAVIATIFANYLIGGLVGGAAGGGGVPPLVLKVGALACVAGVTFMNCLGATAGSRAANVFLVLKLGALGTIVALGGITWVIGSGDGVPSSPEGWFGTSPGDGPEPLWTAIGNFATALFGALFCYGGWESVGFVLGDMANPEGDLPVVINGAMSVVVAGFCMMNAALYVGLPMDVIRSSSTVAVEFARRLLGSWGGVLFSVVVSISAMGALNANVFATAKLCVSASHRSYFPPVLANLHVAHPKDEADYLSYELRWLPASARGAIVAFADATRHMRWQRAVPIYAMIANGLLASFYVVVGSFSGLVTFIGLAEYAFFFLSVIGLLVLRARETPGQAVVKYTTGTWNPIIFSTLSGLLLLRGVLTEPLQGLALLVVGALGLAVYHFKVKLHKPGLPGVVVV